MMNNQFLSAADFFAQNIDIVFIVVLALIAVYGAFRGFFSQLAGFIVTLVAIIAATFLSRPLMLFLNEHTPLVKALSDSLNGWVTSAFPSLAQVDATKISESLQNLSLPEAVKITVQSYASNETGESINLAGLIARAVAGYTMLTICFIFIVILVKIIFLIIRKLGKKLRKNMAVKIVDIILGGVFAFAKAVFLSYFIIFLINFLPFTFLEGARKAIASSTVLNYITEHNFVDILLKLLQL